ncbi:MAG: hypothetical protein JWM04_429 [Verrucomicrobiales bacterium]|nr:hypothetical protein [Verrucomicrobiales bacterium]
MGTRVDFQILRELHARSRRGFYFVSVKTPPHRPFVPSIQGNESVADASVGELFIHLQVSFQQPVGFTTG